MKGKKQRTPAVKSREDHREDQIAYYDRTTFLFRLIYDKLEMFIKAELKKTREIQSNIKDELVNTFFSLIPEREIHKVSAKIGFYDTKQGRLAEGATLNIEVLRHNMIVLEAQFKGDYIGTKPYQELMEFLEREEFHKKTKEEFDLERKVLGKKIKLRDQPKGLREEDSGRSSKEGRRNFKEPREMHRQMVSTVRKDSHSRREEHVFEPPKNRERASR